MVFIDRETADGISLDAAEKLALDLLTAVEGPGDDRGQRCYRFPCDTAHHRGTDQPTENGNVLHEIRCGGERRKAEDGSFPSVWSVRVIAWVDDPSAPYLYFEDERHAFTEMREAGHLAEKLNLALPWAAEANMKDAESRLLDSEAAVVELRELLELDGARSDERGGVAPPALPQVVRRAVCRSAG